jgi:hypothetical protein
MESHWTVMRESESQITEDHLRIRALVDGLKAIGDPHVLVALLRELRKTLDDHFALEEGEEGLGALASDFAPDRTGEVEGLMGQHAHMLRDVDELIKACNAAIAGPLKDIRTRVHGLFDMIQRHDVAESEILTEILLNATKEERAGHGAGE